MTGWNMSRVLKIQGPTEQGLRKLLRALLESGQVNGVFALRRSGGCGVNYSLVTDPSMLEDVEPFHPVMPVQGGRALSHLTRTAPLEEPVAALLRPCELRALVELVKREQASLDNLFVISCSCGGVYPLSAMLEGEVASELDAYWAAVPRNEVPEGVRPACASCVEFVPYGADMTALLLGGRNAAATTEVLLNTPRAEEAAMLVDGEICEDDGGAQAIEEMRAKRRVNRDELFKAAEIAYQGLNGLVGVFGRCIGCRGCREVCPLCYCNLCEFDSHRSELTREGLEADLARRGGLRVPAGTLSYHLGRMSHMAISCVRCGQCTDVCPADIPVSTFFAKVGQAVQGMFDYLPGRDAEEPIPLTTYRTDELVEVED